jgi:hypothetical protein
MEAKSISILCRMIKGRLRSNCSSAFICTYYLVVTVRMFVAGSKENSTVPSAASENL